MVGDAVDGVANALEKERSVRVAATCAFIGTLAAIGLPFTTAETLICAGAFWAILVVEVINSALERAVDHAGAQETLAGREAKHRAAAATLIQCIIACAIWCVVLLKHFLKGTIP